MDFLIALVEFTVGFFVDLLSGSLLEIILELFGLSG